jgi:hypothetical protein
MKSPHEIVQDWVDNEGIEWLAKAVDYVERTGGAPHRRFSVEVMAVAKTYLLMHYGRPAKLN